MVQHRASDLHPVTVAASSRVRRVEPDVVHLPARGVLCAYCGSSRTTSIAMTLTDGTLVDFTSCRACEKKSWVGADGPIELDGVLAKTTKSRV